LLRQLAVDAGAAETILLRDGELTDASASTVYVVIDGELRAPPNTNLILAGTTRGAIEELAQLADIPYRVTRISAAELRGADEVWLSAATREVVSVTQIDGQPIAAGRTGPLWKKAYAEFQNHKRELAGQPW
jgi:D-alanine transaminase